MDFLRTVPRTLPSYYHAVARHSRLPKPLALLASLLVYSEGGREGAGCVSCSVRGRMRGDQAQGRGAILGSQQQPRSPGRRMALNFPTRHAHRTCEMPLKPGRKGRGKKSFRHQPRVSGRGYLSYPRTHVEIPAVGGVLGTDKHDFRPCVKVSLTGFLRP